MSAIVVVPTYNEQESIANLVEAIRKLPVTVHILIVDDSSPGGTGQIADELSRTHPNEVFAPPSRQGRARPRLRLPGRHPAKVYQVALI